jgi:hypothetical protein
MVTVSNIPKPEGGFYQVGDKLETKEQAIAFAQAVGWQFFQYLCESSLIKDHQGSGVSIYDVEHGVCLPYTIKGFLPEHTATATTPNPPLTFDEAMELKEVYLDEPKGTVYGLSPYLEREAACGEFWSMRDATIIDLAVRRGNVYAHDPAIHPPTPRKEG